MQTRKAENMNDEVDLMSVVRCPDPELSYTLKCKPIHECALCDVELRIIIDDYQTKLRATGWCWTVKNPTSPLSSLSSPAHHQQCHTPRPSSSYLQAKHQVCHPPCPSLASVPAQGESHHIPRHASVPAAAQWRLFSSSGMADIFQEMMEKMQ